MIGRRLHINLSSSQSRSRHLPLLYNARQKAAPSLLFTLASSPLTAPHLHRPTQPPQALYAIRFALPSNATLHRAPPLLASTRCVLVFQARHRHLPCISISSPLLHQQALRFDHLFWPPALAASTLPCARLPARHQHPVAAVSGLGTPFPVPSTNSNRQQLGSPPPHQSCNPASPRVSPLLATHRQPAQQLPSPIPKQ